MLIFRQLFDQQSFTYTYLLADDRSREAVLIIAIVGLSLVAVFYRAGSKILNFPVVLGVFLI